MKPRNIIRKHLNIQIYNRGKFPFIKIKIISLIARRKSFLDISDDKTKIEKIDKARVNEIQ